MVDIRPITADEVPAFSRAISRGFGSDEPEDNSSFLEGFPSVCDLDTTLAAFDRGQIVATFASFDLELTVPGGVVPMAGTTVVTVAPTHRRRGILSDMMDRHLDLAMERGQPIAGRWASEEQIYGRFGYGHAATGYRLDLPAYTVSAAHGPSDVTIRSVDRDEARRLLPPLFGRWVEECVGGFRRSDDWWEWRHFEDPAYRRPAGATSRRTVVAERNDEPVGYAVYRQRQGSRWSPPSGHTDVVEIVALDDDARRALWHYLTNVDLFPNVHWWNAPVDEPILVEVDRFRSLGIETIDTLWLRPLDVPTCLAARRYEHGGELTVRVIDGFHDRGGTFRLSVLDGSAECEPVAATAPADVTLDIADLGALYLGGRSARAFARAGRVDGAPAAIRTFDRIFAADAAPYCPEVF